MQEEQWPQTTGGLKTKRMRWLWVVACLLIVASWLSYVTANIVSPDQSAPRDGIDAVVSLAPQHDRLMTAEQIFLYSDASRFLVSYFPDDRYQIAPGVGEEYLEYVETYCTYADATYISCATPEHATTLGEASMIRNAAQQNAWQSLTVVTSKYHAFRTRLILDRCLGNDIEVDVVFSEVHLDSALWLRYIVYENAAYLKAQIETLFRC